MYTKYQYNYDHKYTQSEINWALHEIDIFGYYNLEDKEKKIIDWLDTDSTGLYPNHRYL